MRTVLVLGATMMFGTMACDGGKKNEEKAPAKADAKAKDAKTKDAKTKDAKASDPDIAIGKDGKAQPLGVPGM